MRRIGYVRVSTKDQNPDRQMDAMKALGIRDKYIYVDKISGKSFDRPEYQKMLSKLKKGDIVIVKSIDRLGRNYDEILEQWRFLTREKQVEIEVIDMPLLNTNASKEGLTGVFVSDIVLQILAYVAETERSFIRQRQAEGIAAAKRRGVKFGARRSSVPDELNYYYDQWQHGKISVREAAARLGLSKSTFHRWCMELKNNA